MSLLIPDSFQYSQDMSLSIQGLEDRIDEEKLKGLSANYQKEEIKRMENVLKNMKGEVVESVIRSKLQQMWHSRRGLLLHSFHPENFLRQLKNLKFV